MVKVIEVPQYDRNREKTARTIWTPETGRMEKFASDDRLDPQVRAFIDTIKPTDGHTFKLLTGMCAADWWGQNRNGDRFYEKSLLLRGPKYGHTSFLTAGCYRHHANKNKNKSLGRVILSIYNMLMRRVELVIDYDHKLLALHDSLDLLKLLNPDYSMAAKVPWDECFQAGTLVRARQGYVPIESLVVGDAVRTHAGRLRKVTAVSSRMSTEGTVVITAAGVPSRRSTGGHPYYALREDVVRACKGTANGRRTRHSPVGTVCMRCKKPVSMWQPEWVAASDLQVGDYLLTPVDRCGSVIGNTDRARLLGYYLGDGYITKQRRGKLKRGASYDVGVAFAVSGEEQAHMQTLLAVCARQSPKTPPRVYAAGRNKKAVEVRVTNREVAAEMRRLGGSMVAEKRLHESVFAWSREEKLHLVGGYIDTDGCVGADGTIRISTVNRGLALDTQRLLHALRVPASVSPGHKQLGYGTRDVYIVHIPASAVEQFVGYSTKVRPGSHAPTAATQSFFWGGYWCTPVKRTERAPDVLVYNLSVNGDETYIAEGVAVHNCTICLDIAAVEKILHSAGDDPADQVAAVLAHIKHTPIKGLATKREHYCDHLKFMMGQIIPDGPDQGKQVGANNRFPELFDISQVTTGADNAAKEMRKLASCDGHVIGGAELAEMLGYADEQALYEPTLVKAASVTPIMLDLRHRVKQAALERQAAIQVHAEIDKVIDAVGIPLSVDQEQEIPHKTLSSGSMRDVLSTLGALGIVLHPAEFQRLALSNMGAGALSDELDARGEVFPPAAKPTRPPMGPQFVNRSLLSTFAPFMQNRSCLSPISDQRVAMIVFTKSAGAEPAKVPKMLDKASLTPEQAELVEKCASLYRGYRDELARDAIALVRCTRTHQGALDALWENSYLTSDLVKAATTPSEIMLLGSLFPLLYLYSAHLRKSEEQGEKLGLIRNFVKKHPVISAGAVVGLIRMLGPDGVVPQP